MPKKSVTLIEVLVIIVVILILIAILLPDIGSHEMSKRGLCSSNLKQIFTAMYIYSQDYKGAFPAVPFGTGKIVGEDKSDQCSSFNKKNDPTKDFLPQDDHSISQNMWLLVRGEFAQAENFICPYTKQAGQKVDIKDGKYFGPDGFVDFPWKDTGATISYSFIQPWSKFTDNHSSGELWQADIDPRVVLGADANNGSQPNYPGKKFLLDIYYLKKFVNSVNHYGYGQNVIYGDGHVSFSQTVYAGIGNDNIYTAMPADYKGEPGNTPGTLSVRPRDQFDPKVNKPAEWDTVLIPAKDADLEKWDRKP
ncbi:MAG: hypothetical protein WC975_01340 [Phycisphaerae bacterium]